MSVGCWGLGAAFAKKRLCPFSFWFCLGAAPQLAAFLETISLLPWMTFCRIFSWIVSYCWKWFCVGKYQNRWIKGDLGRVEPRSSRLLSGTIMQSPLQQLVDAFVIPSIEYTFSFISTFPSIWFLDGLASLNSYRSGQCFQPFPVYIRNAFIKLLWCLSFSVSGAEHLTCHLFWTSNVPFRHARKIYIQPNSFINTFISKYLAFIRIIHGLWIFFWRGFPILIAKI